MNNIEILERLEQMQQTFREDGLQGYEMAIVTAKKLINNLIQENKELKKQIPSPTNPIPIEYQTDIWVLKRDYISKSKVKELAKKYEFALNGYDSSTADYKQSQNLGRYMACVELLEEGE